MTVIETTDGRPSVSIGIDAAVVAAIIGFVYFIAVG